MKKLFFSTLGITLPMLALHLISYGQTSGRELAYTKTSSSPETSISKAAGNSVNRTSVASKARKNFVGSYKDVSDEKWYSVTGGFVAMFTRNGVDYQVDYDKNGTWLNTIRTYDESKLPPEVRQAVRSTYYDYNINLVQEIETPFNPLTYVIQLVGKTEIINLKMCDGEMSTLNSFRKSE